MTTLKEKDQSIETLRGLAIILVVAGYIIANDLKALGHSPFVATVDFLYFLLKPIRMPLFTVISAYLYASSPAAQETVARLIHGKFRRLMVPFAFISAIQYVLFSLFDVQGHYPLSNLWSIYFWPFKQFWFIMAIFWIFIVIGGMDALKALDTKGKWLGWLAVSLIPHVFVDATYLFAFHGVNYLMPFFLLGYGLRRYGADLLKPRLLIGYAIASVAAYSAYVYFRDLPAGAAFEAISTACSLAVIPLLIHFRRSVPWLAWIGSYAFGIYIFYRIAIIWPRLLLERLHVDDPAVLLTTYLVCGIAFSIVLQLVLERIPVTRTYLLGMKKNARQKAVIAAA